MKTTEQVQQSTTWIGRVNLGRQMRDAGEKMVADALRERLDKVGEATWLKECESEWDWSRSTCYRHLNPAQMDKAREDAREQRANVPTVGTSRSLEEIAADLRGMGLKKPDAPEPASRTCSVCGEVYPDGKGAIAKHIKQGCSTVEPAKTITVKGQDADEIFSKGTVESRRAERAQWAEIEASEIVEIVETTKDPAVLNAVIEGLSDKPTEPEPVVKTGEPEAGSYTVKMWKGLEALARENAIYDGLDGKLGKAGMNKQTGDSIEWARFSLNTVTGCEHNCPYCYARDIAEKWYPQGFVPTFHPARLAAPGHAKVPDDAETDPSFRNIFANSMSDLFGKWVPADWIEATIEMARRHPEWNFLTLTKFPTRAAEFAYPDNLWLGTSVDAQCRVEAAENAFDVIDCKTKWLSCEPLLEPLTFKRLDIFQWVVIGGASPSTKTPTWRPPFEWTARLHLAALDAGTRVYHKTNLGLDDAIRVRDFPWATPTVPVLPKEFCYLKGLGR